MRHRIRQLLPGMMLGLPLPFLAWWLVGAAPGYVLSDPVGFTARVLTLVALAVLCSFLVHILGTAAGVRELADPQTGEVDVLRAMRPREAQEALLVTGLLMLWMNLLLSGATAMAEVYRASSPTWHDAALWQVEQTIFLWLHAHAPDSWLVTLSGWLYGLMWPFLLITFALVVHRRRHFRALQFAMTVLLMFYARLLIAIAWPTQGPAFAYPEVFAFLDGSVTQWMQGTLQQYQMGNLAQNGLYQGVVAMPSLHIGLTALAAWHLGKLWPSSWWLTVPWLLLTWGVTVLLGWHYVVDGLGGLAVAIVCHGLSHALLASVRGNAGRKEKRA